jgi:hypothetical protein
MSNFIAVFGISCIKPIAPALDTASGSKSDSALMTALNKAGSRWWRFD